MSIEPSVSRTMYIQTSEDWSKIEQDLLTKARALPHAEHDLSKICKNIGKLVAQLSLEEINCRRLHKQTIKHAELMKQINEQIDSLEQLITFAALIQNS